MGRMDVGYMRWDLRMGRTYETYRIDGSQTISPIGHIIPICWQCAGLSSYAHTPKRQSADTVYFSHEARSLAQ